MYIMQWLLNLYFLKFKYYYHQLCTFFYFVNQFLIITDHSMYEFCFRQCIYFLQVPSLTRICVTAYNFQQSALVHANELTYQ